MKVLFVCTGNIFRSMSAEYCLKEHLKREGIRDVEVSSAGTIADIQKMDDAVLSTLVSMGINPLEHKQRKINEELIEESDLIVAMSTDHQDFIRENFGIDVPLFNEICHNEKTAILDNWEAVPNYHTNKEEGAKYNTQTVLYIKDSIPLFYENFGSFIEKYPKKPCKFCGFLKGEVKSHNSGYPFEILHETQYSVSFLSEDVPMNKDAHILVIPKGHFCVLEDVPEDVLSDVINHVKLSAQVLKRTHGACNVLQNDGKSAGQCIFHVHFHIIPRDKGDGIEIELWEKGKFPLEKFNEASEKIKKVFEELKN